MLAVTARRPHLLGRPRLLAVVVLGLLLVVVASLVLQGRTEAAEQHTTARRCERFAAAEAARARQDSGDGTLRTVVIGDSWSAGWGLSAPGASWPSRLPGRVHVDGFPGSGFSPYASPCGAVGFADRVDRALRDGADLVVVQGGLNDVDQRPADVEHGYRDLMGRLAAYTSGDLGAHVVVVGPADAPARASGVWWVDDLLARLSEEYAVTYLSGRGLDLAYLPDRLHLTAAGHADFGDAVAARLPR